MLQICRYPDRIGIGPAESNDGSAKVLDTALVMGCSDAVRSWRSHHRNSRPRPRPCRWPITQKRPRRRAIGLLVAFDPQRGQSRIRLTATLPRINSWIQRTRSVPRGTSEGDNDRDRGRQGPPCCTIAQEHILGMARDILTRSPAPIAQGRQSLDQLVVTRPSEPRSYQPDSRTHSQ
jgi:hypothetical protein